MLMLMTLYVLGALLFFCVLFLHVQNGVQHSARIHADRMIALAAAEAGINEGFSRINHNRGHTEAVQGQLGSGATYSVRFVNNVYGNDPVAEEDGFEVPVGLTHIVSEARFGLARVRQDSLVKFQGGFQSGGLYIFAWWTY